MKRILCVVLLIVMLVNYFPVLVFADSTYLLEVTQDGAPLREKPKKAGKVIVQLNTGDCVTCIGSTVNSAGNLWYKIKYANKEAYIYSGNVIDHTHNMVQVSDTNVFICKCGHYEVKPEGSTFTSYAGVLTEGDLLGQEVAEAVAALGGLGSAVATVTTAALPYVAVVVVCGVIIYISINASATQADVKNISLDLTELKIDMAQSGSYYYCARGDSVLLIAVNNPISKEEADTFLYGICGGGDLMNILNSGYGMNLRGIYTLSEYDAQALANEFNTKHKIHGFECIKDNDIHGDGYYQHFNFRRIFDHSKHINAHIFYGLPVSLLNVA